MTIELTFDLLPVIAAVTVILLFVLPGLKVWYDKQLSEMKQLWVVLLLLGIAVVATLLSRFGFLTVYPGLVVSPPWGWREWIWYPLVDFVIALMTSAGVYKSTNYIFAPKSCSSLPPPRSDKRH